MSRSQRTARSANCLLRFDDFLEQRILGRLLGRHRVVDLELLLQDRVGRLVELDVLLGLQLDVVLRVAVDRLPRHVGRRRFHGVGDDRPHLLRQRVVLGLVEHDLELLGVLVEALQHADLGHVREAEQPVGRRVVELGGVEQAAVHRRDDLAAGQRVDRGAHAGEHVDRDAHRAELEALEVLDLGDRLLEPAERLRRHAGRTGTTRRWRRSTRRACCSSSLPPPYLCHDSSMLRVHAERRARAPQRQRVLLAVVIDEHAVAAVERALRHGVEQAEGGNDGAGGQHLDLEIAAGHVVDLLGEVERVLVEDVLRRPGALPAHGDRARLPLGDHREPERRAGGGNAGGGLQEPAARALLADFRQCRNERFACHDSSKEMASWAPCRGWRR